MFVIGRHFIIIYLTTKVQIPCRQAFKKRSFTSSAVDRYCCIASTFFTIPPPWLLPWVKVFFIMAGGPYRYATISQTCSSDVFAHSRKPTTIPTCYTCPQQYLHVIQAHSNNYVLYKPTAIPTCYTSPPQYLHVIQAHHNTYMLYTLHKLHS